MKRIKFEEDLVNFKISKTNYEILNAYLVIKMLNAYLKGYKQSNAIKNYFLNLL